MLKLVTKEYSSNFRHVSVYEMELYIPNWTTHLAIDGNGEIWAYNSEPVIDFVSMNSWRQPSLGDGQLQELVGWVKDEKVLENRNWTNSKKEVILDGK